MNWLKESNRTKHLLYAILAGFICTILAILGCAFGIEFKGGRFDQLDLVATMIGGLIGQILQILILINQEEITSPPLSLYG